MSGEVEVGVVGAGVVGLSTTVALLERGAAVTCYESAEPMSQRSAGQSRIFRFAHAAAELVELVGKARSGYDRWSPGLIRQDGVVVAGGDALQWAAAMSAAGVAHTLFDTVSDAVRAGLTVLPKSIEGPLLFDPNGGVLDVARIGELLRTKVGGAIVVDPVYRIEPLDTGARVWSAGGRRDFDAVVIVAGAGTCALAAQVGLYTPSALGHHVRFTFPLRDVALRPSCLLDKSESWGEGFTTYQHLVAPGEWAIGADFSEEATAWEVGREEVTAHSRRLVVDYVRENLSSVEDRVTGQLYCTVTPGWGDGYVVARRNAVIAFHGGNLFKLAPAVGEQLAAAVLDGAAPDGAVLDGAVLDGAVLDGAEVDAPLGRWTVGR